jgi:predicted PurR-regulated permease PerM
MFRSFIERAVVVWSVLGAVLIAFIAVGGLAWLIQRSLSVIIMLLIAVLVALLLNPLVDWLAGRRFPRWLAVVVIYLAIVGLLAAVGLILIPLLIKQGNEFLTWLRSPQNPVIQFFRWVHDPTNQPEPSSSSPVMQRLEDYVKSYQAHVPADAKKLVSGRLDELSRASGAMVSSILGIAVAAAEWTFRGVIILVMSIYLLLDKDHFLRWFHGRLPQRNKIRLEGLLTDLVAVLGGYLRGLGVMILFVGASVSLLLLFCGIKYWLFIGAMAGLLEVIPYFGAVAGAIPAVTLGFQKSPGVGVGLIVAFVIINQVEGHLVAPLAMGHTLHLRPLTVLLSLLVGAEVHGVGGMIIAVPVVAIVRVLWVHAQRYFDEPQTDGQTLKVAAEEAMDPKRDPLSTNAPITNAQTTNGQGTDGYSPPGITNQPNA